MLQALNFAVSWYSNVPPSRTMLVIVSVVFSKSVHSRLVCLNVEELGVYLAVSGEGGEEAR